MKLELDLTKEELLKLKDIVVQKYIKLTDHLSILYQRQTDYYDCYDIDKVEKEVNLIQPIVKELENKINEINVTKDGKLYVLGFLTNDYKLFYYDQFN